LTQWRCHKQIEQ